MISLLDGVMLLAGVTGFFSAALGNQPSIITRLVHCFTMATMFAVMLDVVMGGSPTHRLLWCGLLLVLLPIPVVNARRRRDPIDLHRAFSLLVMISIVLAGMGIRGMTPLDGMSNMHGVASPGLVPWFVAVGCAAFVVFSIRLTVTQSRFPVVGVSPGRFLRTGGLEVMSSAVAATAMAVMLI